MARITVRTPDKARQGGLPAGCRGPATAAAYFDGVRDPLHLYRIDLKSGDEIAIASGACDRLGYVLSGAVCAGRTGLPQGSSVIVERGACLTLTGESDRAQVLLFAANAPPEAPLPGGHVHLLPADLVPRSDSMGGSAGVGGAMHADSDCPTCTVWLHENHLAPREDSPFPDGAGIHSHSEDEIIFVNGGAIRLGQRLFGPGTAIAITANTFYTFNVGPDGLSFTNFRAARPSDIVFASGKTMSETGYWRNNLHRPAYVEQT